MLTISLPEMQIFFWSMVSLEMTLSKVYLLTQLNCADQTECLTKIFGHAKARISVRSGHPLLQQNHFLQSINSIDESKRWECYVFHFHAIFGTSPLGLAIPCVKNPRSAIEEPSTISLFNLSICLF